jgi:hypothetical protein
MYQNEPYQAGDALTTERIQGYLSRIFTLSHLGISFARVYAAVVVIFAFYADEIRTLGKRSVCFQRVGIKNACRT